MPTYQRIGSNNHESGKGRRKPAIELNEEPAVVVSETSPALQLAPQDHQLMSDAAFSASSRIFDLNGEAKTATTKHRSPIIPPA
jgi:hypothetical protein